MWLHYNDLSFYVFYNNRETEFVMVEVEHTKAAHYCPFVLGTYRWISLTKANNAQALTCHEFIMSLEKLFCNA